MIFVSWSLIGSIRFSLRSNFPKRNRKLSLAKNSVSLEDSIIFDWIDVRDLIRFFSKIWSVIGLGIFFFWKIGIGALSEKTWSCPTLTTTQGGTFRWSVTASPRLGWISLAMTSFCFDAWTVVSTTCQDSATLASSFSLFEASSQLLFFWTGSSVTPSCGKNSSVGAPMEFFICVNRCGISTARTISDVGRGWRLCGVLGWPGSLPSGFGGMGRQSTSINGVAPGNCCLSGSIVRLLRCSAWVSVRQSCSSHLI